MKTKLINAWNGQGGMFAFLGAIVLVVSWFQWGLLAPLEWYWRLVVLGLAWGGAFSWVSFIVARKFAK